MPATATAVPREEGNSCSDGPSRGRSVVEQVPDAAGGDRSVLDADAPLEQQGHRGFTDPFVDVVGHHERDGAAGVADPADDGAERVCELGVNDQEPSASVLDGAMRSSGMSSPVPGSRYGTGL